MKYCQIPYGKHYRSHVKHCRNVLCIILGLRDIL
jgi:hypothetical protein